MLMRKLAVVLFAASMANAASVRYELVEQPSDDRAVQILRDARSVTADAHGTFWVYHGVNGIEAEPQAAAVTAIRPDGTTRTYLATDILPPGSVRAGMVGQVYAVTPLTTRGFFAATAGWVDPKGDTWNAVVFFREAANGAATNFSIVPAPGARAITAGPADTAVVAAVDPLKNGDLALATIMNANGKVMARFGLFDAASMHEANDRIMSVRFQPIDADSIAVLDGKEQRVHGVRIYRPAACAIPEITASGKPARVVASTGGSKFGVDEIWTVSVADVSDAGATEVFPVTAFSATWDGVVTAVRTAIVEARPRAIISRHTPTERLPTWSSDHVWRAAMVNAETIRGVVVGPTTWEERVVFASE